MRWCGQPTALLLGNHHSQPDLMIQRFHVHNFRCLENFNLLLSGHSTWLLIGNNGSGKSTVGKALEVLQRVARGTNRVGELVKPIDFAWERTTVPMRFGIEVKLGSDLFEYNLAFELPADFKELRVAEERLSYNGENIYSRDRAQVVLSRSGVEREAKFRVDWHLVALPVIQEQSAADPLHVFKQWLAHMLILAPIPSLIRGDSQGASLMPNRECTNVGEWFAGLLSHTPAAYTGIDRFLKPLMPDLYDVRNPVVAEDSRSLLVQFLRNQAAVSRPFGMLSDGEKCFFIGALVLAATWCYGPVFCFWDEPDNHLSLSEVGHFVIALRRAFGASGQLVATSHNPEAIRHFADENTLLLMRESQFEPSQVRPVSQLQIKGDLVNALIRNDLE